MKEIRPLFVAQSGMLEIFYLTAKKLNILNKSSFLVSDMAYYYESFLKKYPDFEDSSNILKEWDIQKKARELWFSRNFFSIIILYINLYNFYKISFTLLQIEKKLYSSNFNNIIITYNISSNCNFRKFF